MRIIDAHVHVLDNFLPMAPFADTGRRDRLLWLMDECGVEKAVMLPVVAAFSPQNNQECADWARQHPDRLATMTDVPLDQADAAAQIRRAREQYGAVAISCYPATPSLAWMLAAPAEAVWQAFVETKLVCNLQVTPPNYPHLIALARRYPQVCFVLNHFGLVCRMAPDDPSWAGLVEAGNLPNVFVKASAFYSVAATAWDMACPVALGVFRRVLGGLGAARLLWGSDWPPASRGLTYRQNLEVVRSVAGLEAAELEAIAGGNAARVYGV
ncbi:MAG: amidohydrolase [Candidatus Latescibacteria bacterium]|nr:amidohydrolase [Candidatus Latescibacterota bacterium]